MWLTYESDEGQAASNSCSIIYEKDSDFGQIDVVEPIVNLEQLEPASSQKLDPEALSHLTQQQRLEFLQVLDRYPECFSDVPGLIRVVPHEVPVNVDFKPKRLEAYRVPENLKTEVGLQISELLKRGIIKRSSSAMASPVVVVLNLKSATGGILPPPAPILSKFANLQN